MTETYRHLTLVDENVRIGPPPAEDCLKALDPLMRSTLPESVLPLTQELDVREADKIQVRLLRCAGVETERIFVEVNDTKGNESFTIEAKDKAHVYDAFWHPFAHRAVIEERREVMQGFRRTERQIAKLAVAA